MRKIIVNTENLISALFLLGYEKIDAILYTLVMGALKNAEINDRVNMFKFDYSIDDSLSKILQHCIKPSTAILIELRDGYSFNTDVSELCHLKKGTITLYDYINNSNNSILAKYIENNINMEDVILKKAEKIGNRDLGRDTYLYSNKELEILNNQKKKIMMI